MRERYPHLHTLPLNVHFEPQTLQVMAGGEGPDWQVPTHTPALQWSLAVQVLLSLHTVPFGFAGC